MFEAYQILDARIDRVSHEALYQRLDEFVQSGRPHQIVTVNTDFLRLARSNPDFRDTINAADLAVPDGVPVVWLAKFVHRTLLQRVTGVDILELAAALASERNYSLFLLGAEPGVADAAAQALVSRYPRLRIAGTYSPPYGPLSAAEEASIITRIREAAPAMLFVALGAPRQDLWIRRHLRALDVPVCVGVGGAFSFVAGRIPRAPRWIQNLGLEWAHRLKQEPLRLSRRYLLEDLPFFVHAVTSALLPLARRP